MDWETMQILVILVQVRISNELLVHLQMYINLAQWNIRFLYRKKFLFGILNFHHVTDFSPSFPVYVMRLLPAVLGSLVVPLVYQIAVELRLSRWAALLAGLCVVFGMQFSNLKFLVLSQSF